MSDDVKERVACIINSTIDLLSANFDESDRLACADTAYHDLRTAAASRLAGAREIATEIYVSLASISPGDEIGDCVLVPKETPAPKWLDRVAKEIDEYRGLQAGWDGENAETPSAHSVNEAVEFIRSLERGDIEPALHADGTVIILIGHTTLRFTNEGMSFVTRAAIAAANETTR